MAINARQYFPIHAVGFAALGTDPNTTGNFRAAKGVQSVRFTTDFDLEAVFQLGQLEIYEHIEKIPVVELTVEKVIDGRALIQHLATPLATISTLAGRYNDGRCIAKVAYYHINQNAASGYALGEVWMSGLYVQALNFNFPVEGNSTESVSFIGNDKRWNYTPSGEPWVSTTLFGATGSPILQSGGVSRRENIIMASSLWPKEIPGIDVNGINQPNGANGYTTHLQSATVSVNLGRTEMFELGRRIPYFRYAEFPTEVTCSIELMANESGDAVNANSTGDNLSAQTIRIWLDQGVIISLGSKSKLTSIDTAGGDAGGGNVSNTYNYSTYNDFTVLSPHNDPAGLTS